MGLLQENKAIFYHPLSDEGEYLKTKTWTGTSGTTAGKVGQAMSRSDISASLSGNSEDYNSAAGATKVGFSGWFKKPSVAPAQTAQPGTDSPIGDAATSCSGTGVNGATVEVFVDDVSVGNADGPVAGGVWTRAVMDAVSTGQEVSCKQRSTGELESIESEPVTVQAYSAPPTVNSPITTGATSCSGSGVNDAIAEVFVDDVSVGDADDPVAGTAWSKTGMSALLTGKEVSAKQTETGKLQSAESNEVTVQVPKAGYSCGGYGGAPEYEFVSTINKLTFSDDSVATNSSGLTGGRWDGVGGFASTTAGYACGSANPRVTTIDKLSFSNDSVATNSNGLTGTRSSGVGGFESTLAGYACGGYDGANLSTIDKLSFSDDTVATNSSGLTATRIRGVAAFAGTAAGYACGGSSFSTIDKLTFADDTVATNSSGLTGARSAGVAGFESTTSGYACGGDGGSPAYMSTIDKLTFNTDAVVTNSSGLTNTRKEGVGSFASATNGYACGGATFIAGIKTKLSRIDKLNFADDTVTVNSSSLTGTRTEGVAGFENR